MYVVAGGFGLWAVVPLAWLLLISLQPSQNIGGAPTSLTLANYAVVLFQSLFPRYILNSLCIALGSTACTLVCACLGAYAATRYRFFGRDATMVALLAASMTPVIALLVPLYSVGAGLHQLNTYQILIVVFTAWQLPGSLWLVRTYLGMVPVELEEAALTDGCSRFGAFVYVVLPQLVPALISCGLVVFVYVWNEFIVAVSLSSQQALRTIPVGLYFYMSEAGTEWGHIAAGAMISLLPPALLFLALQRHFIHGLAAGAVK
jgi:ABC-type glycerol-3-phosphate transport system permease component